MTVVQECCSIDGSHASGQCGIELGGCRKVSCGSTREVSADEKIFSRVAFSNTEVHIADYVVNCILKGLDQTVVAAEVEGVIASHPRHRVREIKAWSVSLAGTEVHAESSVASLWKCLHGRSVSDSQIEKIEVKAALIGKLIRTDWSKV